MTLPINPLPFHVPGCYLAGGSILSIVTNTEINDYDIYPKSKREDRIMGGWIGVDLDGTLAKYDGWKGIDHIGEPVYLMLERVKKWVDSGITVKIFTVRVSVSGPEKTIVISAIHSWLEKHGLPALEVTNVKDFAMIELWDDRAVCVEHNTGDYKRF